MQNRTVQVMQGSDGQSHLLTWNAKGKFRPYCCSVRRANAIYIRAQDVYRAVCTCKVCAAQLSKLCAFWDKIDVANNKELTE